MVRPRAPGWAELGPRRRDDQQRRLRTPLGESLQEIKRGRIGPMQVLERERDGLRAASPRPRNHATRAANCRRRNSSGASFATRSSGNGTSTSGASNGAYSVGSRPIQTRVFSRSASRRSARLIHAKALATPFGDPDAKAYSAGVADDDNSTKVCGVSPSVTRNSSTRRDLPMPGSPTIWMNCPSPLAACFQRRRREVELLLAPDERSEGAGPEAPAAARTHDPEKLDQGGHALEFVRALLLGDKEPSHLPLDVQGDEHRPRLGGRLHARSDIRRVAEHFAGRLHDDRAGLDPDARLELQGAPLAAFLALSSASARWIASAARTARSASFSCARG